MAFATKEPSRPTRQGVTVWLTGLPSAGKTTIANLVGQQLAAHGRAVEVHVATDLATCRARDVKGLYAKQARGELRGLTGVDDPYEPPLDPELVLDTADEPPGASAARVLALLDGRPTPALVGSRP